MKFDLSTLLSTVMHQLFKNHTVQSAKTYSLDASWPEHLRNRLRGLEAVSGEYYPQSENVILIIPDIHDDMHMSGNLALIRRLIKNHTIDTLFLECDNKYVNNEGLERYEQEAELVRKLGADKDWLSIDSAYGEVKSLKGKAYYIAKYGYREGNLRRDAICKMMDNQLEIIFNALLYSKYGETSLQVHTQPGMYYASKIEKNIPLYGVDEDALRHRDNYTIICHQYSAAERILRSDSRDLTALSRTCRSAIDSLISMLGLSIYHCKSELGQNGERDWFDPSENLERSITCVDKTRTFMQGGNYETGLLVAGNGHIEQIITRCTELKQSYIVLKPGYA